MSVAQGVNERLAALTEAGTSVWLDQIRRNLIESGELERMVREDSLRGVTANPSIFEKAILGSPDYDEELAELARQDYEARDIYRRLAVEDVQLAADVLRPVWEATGGVDGYVSLEVAPRLAHDTEGTLEQVRQYWGLIDRPNAMIKIPGTDEGVPAIEQAIYEGINVNVTLLFAVEMYAKAAEAYIRGLERRRDEGKSIDDMHSVASFFVSRVDTEADKRLEALGNTELQGTAAVANARKAYIHFKETFHGDRFASLLEAGAHVQRPLWASTGTKNPHYSETKYIEELVAPETVNTIPMATLLAFAERGLVTGATADADPAQVDAELQALADAGVDMADVTAKLLVDGIEQFNVAMRKLLEGIDARRAAVVTGRPDAIRAAIPHELEHVLAERVQRASQEDVARRVWRRDESLWGGPGVPEIGNRLGWLTVAESMLEEADALEAFARDVAAEGMTDAVLLGMGGSSLAPEVIRRTFGKAEGALELHVLDSTDAGAILDLEQRVDLEHTLFIVSTKSGGTIETLSLARYFESRLSERMDMGAVGAHFIGITDPGSSLVQLAEDHGWRRVFLADPDIGGRYSALSHFGMVPAALAGVDIRAILERAQVAEQRCQNYDQGEGNSGLWLGLMIGELALQGRDKLTFVVDEPIASFGLWAEQLVAESTGKQGRGILPVAGEPLGAPESVLEGPRVRPSAQRAEPRRRPRRRRRGAGRRRPPDAHRRDGGRPPTSAPCSSSPSSRPPWPAGCSRSTRSTSRTCRRPRTTPRGFWTATPRRDGCRTRPTPRTTRCVRCSTWSSPGATSRSWATSSPRTSSRPRRRSCAWPSGTPSGRPRRSATARASCTPRGSSTRAARPPGCSSS